MSFHAAASQAWPAVSRLLPGSGTKAPHSWHCILPCGCGREVYDAASPGYRGRCTAPLLVDRRMRRAVCNESSVIVRNLASVHLPGCTPVDLFPAAQAAEIERVNELVYDKVMPHFMQQTCIHI